MFLVDTQQACSLLTRCLLYRKATTAIERPSKVKRKTQDISIRRARLHSSGTGAGTGARTGTGEDSGLHAGGHGAMKSSGVGRFVEALRQDSSESDSDDLISKVRIAVCGHRWDAMRKEYCLHADLEW